MRESWRTRKQAAPVMSARLVRRSNQNSPTTSPPLRVLRLRYVVMLMFSERNRTAPSPSAKWAPPTCQLPAASSAPPLIGSLVSAAMRYSVISVGGLLSEPVANTYLRSPPALKLPMASPPVSTTSLTKIVFDSPSETSRNRTLLLRWKAPSPFMQPQTLVLMSV